MVLDEESFTLRIDPLECMGTVSVHVSVAIWSSTVRHENGDLMEGLRGVGPEVPGHLCRLNSSLRVSLLAMDEIWEFDRIVDEENRSVVSDQVVIPFFSVELDRKASGVSLAIVGTTLSCDS